MTAADKGRRAAVVAAAVAVMPLAALGTSLIHGLMQQRDAARTEASALRHRPTPPAVTVSASLSPGASTPLSPVTASPSPTSTRLPIFAASNRGSGGGSNGGSGGVPTRPGAGTEPTQPAPSPAPPTQAPPQTEACSPARTAATPAVLGVQVCATVQTAARTGGVRK